MSGAGGRRHLINAGVIVLQMLCDIDEWLQGESQSDIDDILRQETLHEDEWMKQFLDGLL